MTVTLWLDPGLPWPDLVARASLAERAGWDGVRVGDGPGRDCWAVLGALAAAVPRLRLEAVVHDDRGRHPAVVAKLASTVDQLCGGRLRLGWAPAPDVDAEARLAEAFELVKDLAGTGRASFRGRFYQLDDAPLDPKPVQCPFPQMLVGGSPALAASHADHWSITGSPAQVRALLSELNDSGGHRRAVGVSVCPDGTTSFPEYATLGVREWVIPDTLLGPDRDDWPEILARWRDAT